MNSPLPTSTEQFLKDRTYLKNVTPATLVGYRVAFKSCNASFANGTAPVPTKAALQSFVVKRRELGLRPVSTIGCNFNGGNTNGLFSRHTRRFPTQPL